MDPNDPFATMQLQITQTMLEHQMLAQSLRALVAIFAGCLFVGGWLLISMWRRSRDLSELCLAQAAQHSQQAERHASELVATVKEHSLVSVSNLMQMLHAFEGIVSKKPPGSGSSTSARTPTTPPNTPIPPPLPEDCTPPTVLRPKRS